MICVDHGRSHAQDRDALPAVLLSRTLQSVERRCPEIEICLDLTRGNCHTNPVINFGHEIFPRLTILRLHVGNHDPAETHQRSHDSCSVDPGYWSPFFDCATFPNLICLHIRHFWAACPLPQVSLDLEDHCKWSSSHGSFVYGNGIGDRHLRGPFTGHAPTPIGNLDGLEKLQALKLEYVPELDGHLLMRILGDPNSSAANLTTLELRFCNLAETIIANLLFHAPPKLERVVLLCRRPDQLVPAWRDRTDRQRPNVHLCPLLRHFAKNISHVEFGASGLCKQLLLDDAEILCLREEGISEGAPATRRSLDACAIQRSVRSYRTKARATSRDAGIYPLKAAGQTYGSRDIGSESICGNDKIRKREVPSTDKMRCEAERILDAAEERRKRSIQGSRLPWFRRYISWEGSCSLSDKFEELQIAADIEEEGIVWVLASKEKQSVLQISDISLILCIDRRLRLASQHISGSRHVVDVGRALEEEYRVLP